MKKIVNTTYLFLLIFWTSDLIAQKTDYLIICPDILINSANQLKDYRQTTGYTVSVVNLSTIANVEVATAELIDAWLEDYITNNEALKYIVLLGNTNLIPTFYAIDQTKYAGNIPDYKFDSDLWYVIPNDSLNASVLPTIALGRIPISNTIQASDYLAKIRNFESNNSKLTTILFYGNKNEMSFATGLNGSPLGDMEIAKNMGFDTISLIEPTQEMLFDILNTKPIRAVIYYGHGSYFANNVLSESNLASWDNKQNPVIFISGGCSFNDNTMGFTPLGDSLAISPNGSVCSIGASINGGLGPSGYSFADGILRFLKGKPTIGDLYNRALKYHFYWSDSGIADFEKAVYYFTRKMNLIGDPGLIINDAIIPIDTVEYNYTMCLGEGYKGYTQPAIFIEHFESANGRDSIVKTNLFIDKGFTVADDITTSDSDGNVYHKVNIGTQIWMTENLKTTKYVDGKSLAFSPYVAAMNTTISPGYWWYNNNNGYRDTYGALYNWPTVNTGRLCPSGWHVPSNADWTILVDYLGGSGIAGAKLKEKGTANWYYPNRDATNSSGFTARPAGIFNPDMNQPYIDMGGSCIFFSSTPDYLLTIRSGLNGASLVRNPAAGYHGFSVRCIKDSNIPEPVAIAGPGQLVNERSMVTLDGSLSYNPHGNVLKYKWTAPAGITLSSYTIAKPTFSAPEVTENTGYAFTLAVTDGALVSQEASVIISVTNITTGIDLLDNEAIQIFPNQ